MKLTLKIKIKPSIQQIDILLKTIKEANRVCNIISHQAWETKIFNQFRLHKQVYYPVRESSPLSSQMIVRCISKVSDSYKKDRTTKRYCKQYGSIAYDNRILSYKKNNIVSIWTTEGRQSIPFICHKPEYIQYIQGEARLAYVNNKFYLLQVVEVPCAIHNPPSDFIGVDMGITDIATLSNGKTFSSKKLNNYRIKKQKVRSSLQAKGTKGSKRALKRLSGKERRANQLINHTIAKQIINVCQEQSKGIVIEELKGIRKSLDKFSKKQKGLYHKWAFHDLRLKIEYKAELYGIPLLVVDPRYSSKTCSCCNHIGNRNSKLFKCFNCGLEIDADINAALNLSTMGAIVNRPENSAILSCELGLNFNYEATSLSA